MNQPMWIALICLFCSASVQASGLVKISGTLYSSTSSEYAIETKKKKIYYIKREEVPEEQQKQFEKPGATSVSVEVPITAVVKVKDVPPKTGH